MANANEGQKQPQKPEGAPKPPLQNVPPTGQKKTKAEGEAASPLMGKGTPPPQAGAPVEQGKPTMVGAQGQPTMMAGGAQGQPTMMAGGTGQPTMIASQTGKPTMIGTQQGKPTMIAPEAAAQDAGVDLGAAPTPGGGKPTMAPKPATPTMLSKGAAGKTQLMPPEQQPYDLAPQTPGVDPKATMLAKQAQKTQIVKSGQNTTLAPPDKQGPMPLPEGAPQGTILAKDAAKATMLAKGGTPTTLAPPGEQGPMALPEGAPKGTVLARDAAKATLLAKTGQPTSLAPPDEQPLPLPPGSAKKTSMAPSGQPTTLAPPDEGPMDVPGSQKMTMLARSGELTTLAPPDEEPLATPGGSLAKKTSMAPTGQPTVLGPPDEEPLPTPGGNKRTMVAQTGSPTILVPEDAMAEDAGVMPAQPSTVDMGQTASGLMDSSTKYQVAPSTEPKVKPKYGRRWLGGTILGILIGTAAVVGLGLFDLLGFSAPKEWKEALGLYKEPPVQKGEKTIAQKALELLNRGDFQDALAEAEKGDGSNAEIAWLRGEARWLLYVQQQDKAGKKLSLKDDAASKASDELTRAKDKWARATLWLGKMEEKAGDTTKAKDIYEEGMKKFTSMAPMFESALDQLEAAPVKKKKDDGGAMRKMNEAEALAILMIAFQENAEAGKADEAGFDFWRSVKNANKHNYKEAISALDAAIKAHEKNRFQRLRKAQNPQSDPTEEIFLRAATELRQYYQIRDRLNDAKLLTNRTPLEAVDAAIAASKDPGEQLKDLLAMANKELGLNLDKPTVADVSKGLQSVGKIVQGVNGIKEELVKGKYVDEDDPDYIKGMKELMKDAGNKQVVQNIQKRLEKADIKEDDADKGVGIAISQRDKAYELIDTSLKMLEENKYLAEKSKREELPTGVERAIDAGRSPLVSALARAAAILGKTSSDAGLFGGDGLNLAKRLALAEGQVAVLNTRLRMVRTPRDMMDFWPVVLERKPPKEVNDAAALDARRVLDPTYGATANDKGAAYTIQGMVRRNTGEFDAARDDLAAALRSGKVAREGPWRPFALNTLRVLSDPNAYFIPLSDELAAAGKFPEALEVLKEGVGAFPKDGRLLAQRSLVEIDLAAQAALRARKKLNAKDDMVAQARKDATAAIASGALAEGNFAAGRVAEELGDAAAAEKHYRDAIKAHPANDRAGSRYRVALGRVLIQFQPPKLAPEPADGGIPMPNKVGKAPAMDLDRQIREAVAKQDAMALFVLLTVAALQPEDDLDTDPGLDEAIRLGEAAIRAGNPEGYLIKGLALARKGQWTEGLQTYTEGLRRLIKPDQAAGLFYMIDRHPAFQLPDSLRNPDLAVAEKHYANGLRAYFLGQYPQAEKELLEAYRNNGQDARILYYLGLARLGQQNKRDQAVVNFQMGALLERQQKPGSAAVGASLERVQGGPRRTLELYRP